MVRNANMKGGNPHRNYFLGYLLKYFDDGSIYGRIHLCSFERESDKDCAFDLALNVIGQLLANKEEGFYLNESNRLGSHIQTMDDRVIG
jgi:hypothetical protein